MRSTPPPSPIAPGAIAPPSPLAQPNPLTQNSPLAQGNPLIQKFTFSQPVHVDEPIDDTLEKRFSLSESLDRIKQIDEALNSFQKLTQKTQAKLGRQIITAVGNTSPEIQTLGFENWVGSVEGTLRQQNYQIRKLEWELAQKQYQDGEISQEALDQKQAEYHKASQEFKAFLNSFRIAD